MHRSLFVIAGVLSMAAAQAGCALSDHPNCASWVRNGFCANSAYSKTMKANYCPKSCGAESGCSGGSGGTATTKAATSTVENKNCGKWNLDPKTAFCAAATPVQKKTFCFTTCATELAATVADDCAIYVSVGGKVTRTGAKKETTAATVIDSKATATDNLLWVYAKKGCTASVYTAAAPNPATAAAQKTYTGDAEYFKVADTEKAMGGWGCKCP